MPDQPNEFAALMERVAQRDQQAAARLYSLYQPRLMSTIRGHVNLLKRLRPLVDEEDLTQNVWAGFFTRPAQREHFATPEQLMQFLARMVQNQLLKAARDYLDAQKRNLRRERHLSDPATAGAANAVADPTPTPSRSAQTNDEWERWFQGLTSEQRQVALLMREGFTIQDITVLFECLKRTVERIAADIRRRPQPH